MLRFDEKSISNVPDIILFAISFSVSDKTGTIFVKEHLTFTTFKTGRVPLQVRSFPEDVLVMNLASTANTMGVFAA